MRNVLQVVVFCLVMLLGGAAHATQSLTLLSPQGAAIATKPLQFTVRGDKLQRVTLRLYHLTGKSGATARARVLAQTQTSQTPRSTMTFRITAPAAGQYQAEAQASGAVTATDEVSFSIAALPRNRPSLELGGPSELNPPGAAPFSARGTFLKSATLRAWKLQVGGGQSVVFTQSKPLPPRPPKTSTKYQSYEPVIKWSVPLKTPGVYLVEIDSDTKLKKLRYVRVSDLGVVVKRAPREALIYAVRLSTGKPLPNVAVRVDDEGVKTADRKKWIRRPQPSRAASTRADGVTRFYTTPASGTLRVSASAPDGSRVYRQPSYLQNGESNATRVLFYTERPLYRPGQTVYFKGIARRDLSVTGQRDLKSGSLYAPVANAPVEVVFTDAENQRIRTLKIKTNATGAFAGQVELRDGAPVGRYTVESKICGEEFYNRFAVQEYRKPEYEVTLTPQLSEPFAMQGTPVRVLARARYFFGAPVKGAKIVFSGSESKETQLDENGEAVVTLANPILDTKTDTTLTEAVNVVDDANRTAQSSVTIAAPYARITPSLNFDKNVYKLQETAKIVVRTVDPVGRSIAARAKVTLFYTRKTRVFNQRTLRNSDSYEQVAFFSKTVQTDRDGNAQLEAKLGRGGYINAVVTARDDKNRERTTSSNIWVISKVQSEYSYYGYDFPTMRVLLDKESYAPGDTVRALITTSKTRGTALITLQGDRIFMHRVIPLAGRVTPFEFVVPQGAAPGAHLVAGTTTGRSWVEDSAYVKAVSPAQQLNINIKTDKREYRPGTAAKYTIQVRDGLNRPQRADVSLGLVDKAIYALAADETPNPTDFFYGERPSLVSTAWIFPGEVAGGSYQRIEQKVPVRRNFQDTAYWNPFVTTGADGVATLSIPLPDNLTTWRATARGMTSDTKAGVATDDIVATKPLLTRLILPRFLTQTDRIEAQVIVQNNTASTREVRVSLHGDGFIAQSVGSENKGAQDGKIAPGASASFRWMVGADEVPVGGVVRVLATARSGDAATSEDSDAQEIALPIQPRGVLVKQWNAGVLRDANASFSMAQPDGAVRNASRLEVSLSPSIAGPLLGALPQLIQYPYGCTEQTLSRFVPSLAAARALKTLKQPQAEVLKEMPKIVERSLATLYAYQHGDGGWGWWPDDDTDSYMTAYAVYGLSLAKSEGYDVDRERVLRGLRALYRRFGDADVRDAELTGDAVENTRRNNAVAIAKTKNADARAYLMNAAASAQSVFALTKDERASIIPGDQDYAGAVFKFQGELSNYGVASLALAMGKFNRMKEANTLLDLLESRANTAVSSSGALSWWAAAREGGSDWNDSSVEATALALQAFSQLRPGSKLVSGSALWLLANRRGAIWLSTKDSAQAVIALSSYLRATRELESDETARVLVNGKVVREVRFTAANIDEADVKVVLDGLNENADVRIERSGRGAIYYSAELDGYTTRTLKTGADNGLRITRKYQLRDAKGKWRDLDGQVPAGAIVRVDLRVETDRDTRYLLLEDLVPAGFEARPEDDREANKQEQKCDCDLDELVVIDPPPGWSALPVQRRESRDNRQAWFVDYLAKGKYYLRYALRPEQAGSRTAPPARIEAMYQPDINGHSAETSVDVAP